MASDSPPELGFGAVRFSSGAAADASSAATGDGSAGKTEGKSVRFSGEFDEHADAEATGEGEDAVTEASRGRSRRRRGRKHAPPPEPRASNLSDLESMRPTARSGGAEDSPDDLVRECFSLCASLQQALQADVLQVSPRGQDGEAGFASTTTIGLMLSGTEIDNAVIVCTCVQCA